MAERKKASAGETEQREERQPYRVRLPGLRQGRGGRTRRRHQARDLFGRYPPLRRLRTAGGGAEPLDGFHAIIERTGGCLMQDEPEASVTSAHDEGSPRTIAASANPGARNPGTGL